jgi:hypothetical protein
VFRDATLDAASLGRSHRIDRADQGVIPREPSRAV